MAKQAARKRARTTKGHYKADDPSTPDVNEAFVSVGGVETKSTPRKKTMLFLWLRLREIVCIPTKPKNTGQRLTRAPLNERRARSRCSVAEAPS